jgi:hypothetical protein
VRWRLAHWTLVSGGAGMRDGMLGGAAVLNSVRLLSGVPSPACSTLLRARGSMLNDSPGAFCIAASVETWLLAWSLACGTCSQTNRVRESGYVGTRAGGALPQFCSAKHYLRASCSKRQDVHKKARISPSEALPSVKQTGYEHQSAVIAPSPTSDNIIQPTARHFIHGPKCCF